MAHRRKQIRDAIAARLRAVPAFADRVHVTRLYPVIEMEELPVLAIYTIEEESERDAFPKMEMRDLDVAVDAFDRGSDTLDDDLDAHAVLIEGAMGEDPSFGGLAVDSWLAGTEVQTGAEGEVVLGRMRLRYRVRYRCPVGQPE